MKLSPAWIVIGIFILNLLSNLKRERRRREQAKRQAATPVDPRPKKAPKAKHLQPAPAAAPVAESPAPMRVVAKIPRPAAQRREAAPAAIAVLVRDVIVLDLLLSPPRSRAAPRYDLLQRI